MTNDETMLATDLFRATISQPPMEYFFLFLRRKETELYWTLFYLTLTDWSTHAHQTGPIRVPTEAIVLRVETKVSVLSKRVVRLDKGQRHECTSIYFTTRQKVTKGKQVVLDLSLRRREQTKSADYHLLTANKQTVKNVIKNQPILWRDLMQPSTFQQPQVSVVLRSHPPHFMDYHSKTTFLP